MSIEVISPGFYTTVQDLGRHGYRYCGMPVAGAMDQFAARVANRLVGNDERAALLECTLKGPALLFGQDLTVALCGGDFGATLDGVPLAVWRSHIVKKGQVLEMPGARTGCRAYLAVSGGIDVPLVLGSRSTFARMRLGGLNGRPLEAGDVLYVLPGADRVPLMYLPEALIPRYLSPHVVSAIPGPHQHRFTEEEMNRLFQSVYTVRPESDRMGARLDGPSLRHVNGADIVPDGVVPGAIQVPGDGLPIVLMMDAQTTGGYPKIATVISSDLPLVAQARPGDRLQFRKCSLEEAYVQREKMEAAVRSVKMAARRYFLTVNKHRYIVDVEEM